MFGRANTVKPLLSWELIFIWADRFSAKHGGSSKAATPFGSQ
jgi:hypothetical protein